MLSAGVLDRDALRRGNPDLHDELMGNRSTKVLQLHGDRCAVTDRERPALAWRAPVEDDLERRWVHLGRDAGRDLVAVLHPPATGKDDPVVRSTCSLRALAPFLHGADLAAAVTAVGMAHWHATQGFCSRCGGRTVSEQAGWVYRCEQCGGCGFPRTDPAVIMAVVDDSERLLLARGTRFRHGTNMSVLAGFVEPGESLDAAVRREVFEEVGIEVGAVEYVDNQPWPMPASLMIGFMARARTTSLNLDPSEIGEARWFTRDELSAAMAADEVSIPSRISIARHLVERWYGREIGPQPGDVRW